MEVDPAYFRPSEVEELRGDAMKARERLGWSPTVGFEQLVDLMTDADLKLARREKILLDAGEPTPERADV